MWIKREEYEQMKGDIYECRELIEKNSNEIQSLKSIMIDIYDSQKILKHNVDELLRIHEDEYSYGRRRLKHKDSIIEINGTNITLTELAELVINNKPIEREVEQKKKVKYGIGGEIND